MKLYNIYLVTTFVYTYGSCQPLPSPNPELVQRFQTVLDLTLGAGIGILSRSTSKEDVLKKNVLFSPISAIVLTAELMLGKSSTLLGSESDLHQQLSEFLQLLESTSNATKHFALKRQDAIFVDKQFTLNRNYIENLRKFYAVTVHYVDFQDDSAGAQRLINSWGSSCTNGHIKTILPSPPSSVSSIFTSATYLQATWQMPFSYALNKSQFFNLNSTTKVPTTYLTHQFEQIVYGESLDYSIIVLPYAKEEVGMYIILPKSENRYKYDLKSLIARMSFEEVQETISKAQRQDVFVKIPKMSLSRSFSVKADLMENVGLKEENIDLPGAVASGNLRVDDVLHQVVVDFDQKNVEVIGAIGTNLVGGVKNFIVDRPFLFFVRHEATTAMLFMGAVSDPTV